MSTLQDAPPSLRFNVFWASSALKLERVLDKCYDHILGVTALFIAGQGDTLLVANDLRWAAFRMLFRVIQPFYPVKQWFNADFRKNVWNISKCLSHHGNHGKLWRTFRKDLKAPTRRDALEAVDQIFQSQISREEIEMLKKLFDYKLRRESFDMALNSVISIALVSALFRHSSPFALSRTNLLTQFVYAPREYTWMPLAHFAIFLLLQNEVMLYLLVRMSLKIRRIGRFMLFITTSLFETFLALGIHLVKSNTDRLFWVFANCFRDLIDHVFWDAVLWSVFCLQNGGKHPYDGAWRKQIPRYWYTRALTQLCMLRTRRWRNFPRRNILRGISSTEKAFTYKPLDHPGNIRLLLLHPRSMLDDIHCTIFQVPLRQAPQYEALSHTWGTSKETCNIRVNGQRLEVPKSTYRVLASRSSFWKPRLVWIDSICINQNDATSKEDTTKPDSTKEDVIKGTVKTDNSEKSSQLKLMGDIYRSAFVVTVCLQPPEQSWVREGLEWVEAALACDILDELVFLDLRLGSSEFDIFRRYGSQVRKPRWEAFQNLAANSWFNRVWVVQEVSLASSVRVLYGKTEIPWQHLVEGLGSCFRHPAIGSLMETTRDFATRKMPPRGISNIQLMSHVRRTIEESKTKSLPFSSTLFLCHKFQSTDPRDKVFGIQGFCEQEQLDATIRPNYNKSTIELYLDTAGYLLKREDPLRLLSYAGIGYFGKNNRSPIVQNEDGKELPSWCPDWSRQPIIGTLSYRDSTVFSCPYQAGRDGDGKPTVWPDEKPPTLLLRGRVIDALKTFGPEFGHLMTSGGDSWKVSDLAIELVHIHEGWRFIIDSDSVQEPYPHTQPKQRLREVYWRTLIGDRTRNTRPAPPSHGDDFERWVNILDEMVESGIILDVNRPLAPKLMQRYGPGPSFRYLLPNCAYGRKLCITELGYIGVVPRFSRDGDIICLIQGAQVPFVLRPVSKSSSRSDMSLPRRFELVGEAYIHGIMDGELFGRKVNPPVEDLHII